MLLKLPWLTVDIFADVLGEIPGQFDRGGSRPWPLHIYLAAGSSFPESSSFLERRSNISCRGCNCASVSSSILLNRALTGEEVILNLFAVVRRWMVRHYRPPLSQIDGGRAFQ